MSGDTNLTLTEDDIVIEETGYSTIKGKDCFKVTIYNWMSFTEAEQLKQQILTALEFHKEWYDWLNGNTKMDIQRLSAEYPKLKEDYGVAERLVGQFAQERDKLKMHLDEVVKSNVSFSDQILKLKAENEELTKTLNEFSYQYDASKKQVDFLQQENESLKRLKERLAKLLSEESKVHDIHGCRDGEEHYQWIQSLQRLLKSEDDTK